MGNFTVLMCAASYQSPEAVALLLKAGADPNAKTVSVKGAGGGCTALYEAINGGGFSDKEDFSEENKLRIIDLLLKAGADPNSVFDGDETPLYSAANSGYLKIVKCLIDAGANFRQAPTGCIPALHGAAGATSNDIAVVRFLIDKGAFVDETDSRGVTALMVAAYRGGEEVVEFLLEHGANPNHRAKDGRTPLISAALYAQDTLVEHEHQRAFRVVKRLVDAGADPKTRNEKKEGAFDIASRSRSALVAEYLKSVS